MAYSAALNDWLAGMSIAAGTEGFTTVAGDVKIPKSILPELDIEGDDSEVADFPNVLYAILQALYLKWFNTDVANRPVNWAVYKSVNPSATVEGESTVTFNIQFNTALATGAVNVKAL